MSSTIPTPPVPFRPVPLSPEGRPELPRSKPPANDTAPLATGRTPGAVLLVDPRVRAYLQATVAPLRIPQEDKEDLVGEVVDALWRRRGDAGIAGSIERTFGLAKVVLERRIADYWRRRAVQKRNIADAPHVPGEDPPERNARAEDRPDAVDRLAPSVPGTPERSLLEKDRLAFVKAMAPSVGMTDDDVEVMWAMTWDETATWEELAAERRVRPGTLRRRIARMQDKLRQAWLRELGVRTTLLMLVLLLLLGLVMAVAGAGGQAPPPDLAPVPTGRAEVHGPTLAPVPEAPVEDPGSGRK